jgi:hypothetical protein
MRDRCSVARLSLRASATRLQQHPPVAHLAGAAGDLAPVVLALLVCSVQAVSNWSLVQAGVAMAREWCMEETLCRSMGQVVGASSHSRQLPLVWALQLRRRAPVQVRLAGL